MRMRGQLVQFSFFSFSFLLFQILAVIPIGVITELASQIRIKLESVTDVTVIWVGMESFAPCWDARKTAPTNFRGCVLERVKVRIEYDVGICI